MDRNTNSLLETGGSQSTKLSAVSTSSSTEIYSMVEEQDQATLKIWLEIETAILKLKAESNPRIKASIAKELSASIAVGLLSLTGLFAKYPVIQEKYSQYGTIIAQLSSYMNASVVALKQSAIAYFKTLYPDVDPDKYFTFLNKNEGDQLGQILKVMYVDEEKHNREVYYFIKTHQNGSNSHGTAAPVDLKELFVYKALEKIHLGPKAHFFTTGLSTQNGFYIATRGFPFSKSVEKQKSKIFYTYSKFQEDRALKQSTDLKSVDNRIIHWLTVIDIISRIFKLSDVATNFGNFGFVLSGESIKGKIIDFRVGIWDTYTYPEGLLQGFLVGNGTYNYLNFVGTALRDRLSVDKIAEAKAVIESLTANVKIDFYTGVAQAYAEVLSYAKENKGIWQPTSVLEASLQDLDNYYLAIKSNFATFVEQVAARAEKQKQALVLKV